MRTTFLALAALAVAVAGCDAFTHEPTGSNPVEVDPTPGPVAIDLRTAPDTLVVWDEILLRYDVAVGEGQEARSVEVRFDDEVVATTPSRSGVGVDTGVVPDGTYRLRVTATATAGTGSLGDNLGAETTTAEVTRVVVVDNAPVEATPASLSTAEGVLEVQWEARPRPSFEGYRVYRIDSRGVRRLVFETGDPSVTSWADPDFFVGTASFAVDVAARGDVAAGAPVEQVFEPPTLVALETVGDDQVRLRWTATPFSGQFLRYEILERSYGGESRTVASVTAAADTTLVLDVPDVFAAETSYTLRTLASRFGMAVGGGTQTVGSDDPVAPVSDVFGAVGGALIASAGGAVVRADPDDLTTLAAFGMSEALRSIVVGQDGRIGVFSSANTPPFGRTARLLDGTTLAVLASFSPQDALGDRASLTTYDGKAVLTDDGRMITSYNEYWSPATYAYLGALAVDMMTGAVENRLDATGTRPPSFNVNYAPVRMQGATPDGRYVLLEVGYAAPALYEVGSGNGFTRRAAIPASDGLAFVSSAVLARLDGDRIRLLDVPSLTERASFTTALQSLTGYDPATGLLVGPAPSAVGAGRRLVGYDPATGAKAFDVEAVVGTRYVAGLLLGSERYRRVAPLR